jgi:hypothetical protein
MADMVVRHLVAFYRSADLEFSLTPVHVGIGKEAEASTMEDPEVDAAIAKVVPGSGGLWHTPWPHAPLTPCAAVSRPLGSFFFSSPFFEKINLGAYYVLDVYQESQPESLAAQALRTGMDPSLLDERSSGVVTASS